MQMDPLYKTEAVTLDISGHTFTLKVVSNIDELFSDLVNKGADHEDVKDERIPYWAELWPSAIAMAEFLMDRGLIKKGMQVTELGCGIGLPGIVAGKMGAQVIFTDYLQSALQLAEINFRLNNCTNALFKIMDWRHPNKEFSAELVLASDVAYERKSFPALIRCLKALCKPDGHILLAEPNRNFASGLIEELKKAGFTLKSETESITLKKINYTIHLHLLSWS